MNQPPFDVSLPLTRRNGLRALAGAAALACEIPARLALAAPSNTKDNSQQRLVVIMLRGALDGLAAVPATGDPAWADLRGHAEAAARSHQCRRRPPHCRRHLRGRPSHCRPQLLPRPYASVRKVHRRSAPSVGRLVQPSTPVFSRHFRHKACVDWVATA